MPKYLAIDWDRSDVRFVYVSAASRGARLRILAAGSIPRAEEGDRSAADIAAEIGAQLRAALDQHSIGRVPALVGVARSGMDLLPLSLPPATDAELPGLVANEVFRESSAAADGAAFDFFAYAAAADAPRKVLAAVLSAEHRKQIEATAEAARLRLQRCEPRLLAATAMFQRLVPPSEEWHLLVHPGAEEADFVILRAGQILFARTARLPAVPDKKQRDAWLETEINRTLTVAAAEGGEVRLVEGVYVLGGPEEYEMLCEEVRKGLLLPAHVVNPLETYELPEDFAPAHPGRFAALLGMLADEVERRTPPLDFLNPHRPTRRIGRMKLGVYAGVAVLLALLLGGDHIYRQVSAVWEENTALAAKLKKLDGEVRQEAKPRQQYAAIRAWQAGNIVWLDELRNFAMRFPPARDALVLRMHLGALPSGGGTLIFQGLVRNPALVVGLEYALRDAQHLVQCRRIQTGSRPDEDYTHLFDATVLISKAKPKTEADDAERR